MALLHVCILIFQASVKKFRDTLRFELLFIQKTKSKVSVTDQKGSVIEVS